MKVLVVHNRYQSKVPSGENLIVESEIELLRSGGVEVNQFIEDSDELLERNPKTLMSAAMGPIVSPRGVRRMQTLLAELSPDIVHLHNVFPLISPWVIRTASARKIHVVQTVHNYRHTCVAGTHLRDRRVCEDCRKAVLPWPAVRHGCYRDSRLQTTLMGLGQVAHRSTWRHVDCFLIASPLMGDRLQDLGVPTTKMELRPTFAEDLGRSDLPSNGGVAFVGRLEEAKGIEVLLSAWTGPVAERWGRLVIAGSGPFDHLVEAASSRDPSIEWRGRVDKVAVRQVMREAQLVVVPSLWFEGFPRVVAEAMSLGRPLAISEVAGVSWVAEHGTAWKVGANVEDWTRFLLELDSAALPSRSDAARNFYERWCSPSGSLKQLSGVYERITGEGETS